MFLTVDGKFDQIGHLDIARLHRSVREQKAISADQGLLGGIRLPTFTASARTFYRGVVARDHMAEFSASPVYSTIDMDIKNYPGSDTFTDEKHQTRIGLSSLLLSEPQLGQGGCVSVVLNGYFRARCSLAPRADVLVAPVEVGEV